VPRRAVNVRRPAARPAIAIQEAQAA